MNIFKKVNDMPTIKVAPNLPALLARTYFTE